MMKRESAGIHKGLLVAALLIQINIGSLYAWNIISSMLIEKYGFSAGVMGIVYGATLLAFTGSMIPVGRYLHTFSPRLVVGATILLYSSGVLLTAFSNGAFLLILLGHGLLVGLATGLGYVSTTTYGLLPFKRKSIPMGFIVAAFALGSILVAEGVEKLADHAYSIEEILVILVIFQTALMLPALFLVPAKPFTGIAPASESGGAKVSIKPLVTTMFAATFGGLLIISNIKQITVPLNSEINIPLTLILFSLGNGLSRVFFGIVQFQKHHTVIVVNMLLFVVLLLSLSVTSSLMLIMVSVFGMGVLFGSFFVLFPMVIVEVFGQNNFAKIYPRVFLAYGLAATVSAPLGGAIYEIFHHPQIALVSAAVIELAGALILIVFFSMYKKHNSLKLEMATLN